LKQNSLPPEIHKFQKESRVNKVFLPYSPKIPNAPSLSTIKHRTPHTQTRTLPKHHNPTHPTTITYKHPTNHYPNHRAHSSNHNTKPQNHYKPTLPNPSTHYGASGCSTVHSINCQNLQVIFWHLIESSNNGIFSIIKTFDQLPKKNGRILAVDQKLKITKHDINKNFDQLKTC
jgi:hypothetical protein